MRNLLFGIVVILTAAVLVMLMVQHRSLATLRVQNHSLLTQVQELTSENQRLSTELAAVSQPARLPSHLMSELLRLRGEVGVLRRQLAEAKSVAEAESGAPTEPPPSDETNQFTVVDQFNRQAQVKSMDIMTWVRAFQGYAQDHDGASPETFAQARPYLPDPENVPGGKDQLEVVYRGSWQRLTNQEEDIIVLREKQLWQDHEGKWGRVYGFANGGTMPVFMTDASELDQWEEAHTLKATVP